MSPEGPAPTITSVSPTTGTVGTELTIKGANFRAGANVPEPGVVLLEAHVSVTHEVPQPTDQQLVELALDGDERAYGVLVRRYRDKVFRETFALVRDWDVADSATHEAFRRAFRGLERYEPERGFSPWLLRIARNAALNRLAKKKVAMLPIEGSLLADTDQARKYTALQVSARGKSPLEEALSRERDDQIRLAMARLRPEHREAVLMHIDQVPHAEIARRMGVPINTVGTYISRARAKLKKALKDTTLPE